MAFLRYVLLCSVVLRFVLLFTVVVRFVIVHVVRARCVLLCCVLLGPVCAYFLLNRE